MRATSPVRAYTTKWFLAAFKDTLTTATPGTWDPAHGAVFGRIHVQERKQIESAHLHLDAAHGSGTMAFELYRNRGQTYGDGSAYGTMTKIATVSVSAGKSDGYSVGFTWVDEAYRLVQADDYLHLLPTSKPGGSGWFATVDVHFV